jgi:hypothetical protein
MLTAAYMKYLRRPLLLTAIALVLGTMFSAILAGYKQCGADLLALHIPALTVSVSLCALYVALNALGWTLVLKIFGKTLPASIGIPTWIRSEAFRWLPGSIWNFGARAAQSRKHGIPTTVGAASILGELIFSISARLIIVAAACAFYGPTLMKCLSQMPPWGIGMVTFVIAAAGLGVVLRRRLTGRKGSRVLTMKQVFVAWSAVKSRGRDLFAVMLYYVAICALQGIALKYLIVGLDVGDHVPTLALIAVNAAAWLVGFVTVFAPSGIVIREAVLATALTTWLSPTHSLAVAVGWRMMQIAVEATLFLLVLICSKSLGSGSRFVAVPHSN